MTDLLLSWKFVFDNAEDGDDDAGHMEFIETDLDDCDWFDYNDGASVKTFEFSNSMLCSLKSLIRI